jgi:DNA-binding transcriptional LysR family regulator
MPRRLATRFVQQMPLTILAPPVPPIAFRIQLVWHERTHADPGARFFRSVVLAAVRSSRGGPKASA